MKLLNKALSRPLALANRFLPVVESTTDWWMCIALPGCPAIGFAMKVA